jgi:hypothetical protein
MRTDLPLRGGLAEQGRAAEEDLLRANFFLLEFLDQLSLDLCFGRLVFQRMEMLYPRPGESPVSARFGLAEDGSMRVNPWPFNCERLELDVPARRLSGERYHDEESLRLACESAESCNVRVVMQPGG